MRRASPTFLERTDGVSFRVQAITKRRNAEPRQLENPRAFPDPHQEGAAVADVAAMSGADDNNAALAALDWLGRPVRCNDCPHDVIRAEARCDLGRICVRDQRARRIDRFFAANPEEADKYLKHPYFEARVLAAKYASVFLLPPLMEDPEPDVRTMVAHRLPVNRIAHLANDPDRKVRMVVAQRLEGAALVPMLNDKDYWVRLVVVKRVPEDVLPVAMHDPDPQVRREVARRIKPDVLPAMSFDPDPLVRVAVAARLEPKQLLALVADKDLRVRYVVAERGTPAILAHLRDDPDPEVTRLVCSRMQAGAAGAPDDGPASAGRNADSTSGEENGGRPRNR